jgi:hypothetical protein
MRATTKWEAMRNTLPRNLLALFSSLLLAGMILSSAESALADGMVTRHRVVHHYHHYSRLPPERHVLEGIHPPGSNRFLINGRYFAAASPACARWLPGDRITLLAGDWHGYCEVAVFRNLRQGGTCTMWC